MGGGGELGFHGDKAYVGDDDKALEMDGGDNGVNGLNATELYTYKWLIRQVLLYILHHNEKGF